jgi:hypothetical protein
VRQRLWSLLGESRRALSEALPAAPPEWIVPREIVDGDGRAIRYLRLSITDRCDMACTYCMPPGGEGEHGLARSCSRSRRSRASCACSPRTACGVCA